MTILSYVLIGVATSIVPDPPPPRTDAERSDRVEIAQVMIRQRIIIRIPAMNAPAMPVPAPRQLRWKEVKGPKCLPLNQLAGALITRADSIDLVLRGGRRLRAQLDDDCPTLNDYGGFYIAPTKDGQVCGGRDTIHTRAGGQCEIARFKELVPQK